ncbi:MAG: 4-(cytidine 5'-diphospho)-2-C-methyl-D-erythritol kinase [Oscillospiraceae bacterium]|nr:4-(cytidine 5'-diphospho)-2-C-methyl-D-erythritol kinase [Oscillospiraceae bacterium]
MTITVAAPAKINLTLDITGRLDNGYHTIRSVMQAVDLADRITLTLTGRPGIRVSIDDRTGGDSLPADSRNTAYRAAALMFAGSGYAGGAEIHIEKHIPQQAGLGGGSADAAGVLTGLNRLLAADFCRERLMALGAEVGADVPFCVHGGTALAAGIGADISPLPTLPGCHIVIAKPAGGVSTAEAYRLADGAVITARPDHDRLEQALRERDLPEIGALLCNVFEPALALPETGNMHTIMRRHRCLGCQMTGSGSASFALFDNPAAAADCAAALRGPYPQTYLCRPVLEL